MQRRLLQRLPSIGRLASLEKCGGVSASAPPGLRLGFFELQLGSAAATRLSSVGLGSGGFGAGTEIWTRRSVSSYICGSVLGVAAGYGAFSCAEEVGGRGERSFEERHKMPLLLLSSTPLCLQQPLRSCRASPSCLRLH